LADLEIDHDTTRATATLLGLTIEVMHRRSPGADAEQITISLQATPSFAAFGHYLDGMNPFAVWAQFAQAMWAPFLGPWAGALPRLSGDTSAAPEFRGEKKLPAPEGRQES
jgi:hypothetical protein